MDSTLPVFPIDPAPANGARRPAFSVILCAYTEERWSSLCAAIEAVENQTFPPGEVILVIDHNPALFERARESLKNVILLKNQQQRGLSGSRNTGLSAAKGRIIAFIDEDAIPDPDWLEQLGRCYQEARVIGAGGAIEPLWESQRPIWFPAEFDWVVGCSYQGLPEALAPVRNLIGCNMSFRREAFELAGGFRNDMGRILSVPAGCEETELCIRLHQRQPEKLILYQPEAKVKHRVPALRARWAYFCSRCYAEGRSKALVALYTGSSDGLATERAYMFHTLPQGASRYLLEGIRDRRADGFLRALAIPIGLAITAAGYLAGSISRRLSGYKPPTSIQETING